MTKETTSQKFRSAWLRNGMVAFIGAVLFTATVGARSTMAQDIPDTIYIASGQTGSLQHTVASAVAKVISDSLPTTAVVRPYSGTTAFFPILDSGEIELGLAPSVDFALSFQGPDRLKVGDRNPYPATPNLRLVASGSKLISGMLVRNDASFKTVGDLKGARLGGNYSAHLGAYINTYAHLLNAGLTWDDVDLTPVAGLNQGLDALANGRVDGAVYGVGAPRVREVDAAIGVRFLPDRCDDAAKKRVTDAIPGYTFITLPKDRLPGIVEDTCITAYSLYLVASTSTSDAIVSAVTKALYDNADKLATFHPTLKGWKAATSVSADVTLPYHNAAKASYTEAGIWTEEAEATRAKLLE
jgi:uncharacterized protein